MRNLRCWKCWKRQPQSALLHHPCVKCDRTTLYVDRARVREVQKMCDCGAYHFPHRAGGGLCGSEEDRPDLKLELERRIDSQESNDSDDLEVFCF